VSNESQNGFREPQEVARFTNPFGVSYPFCYAIINFANQAAPRILNVTISRDIVPNTHVFNTTSISLAAPADAPGDLIAVGAVNWPTPSTIEPFSSRGPTFDGRSKPDLVAVDGVSVTGAGGFENPFFGTSAAAPHVAGIAALLLQLNPGLSRAQLKSVLQQSAVPLGPVNTYGSGRVNGLTAANLLASRSAVVAAVLPASRSVQVGATATAFATIIVSGTTTGIACSIALASSIPATFQYQTTDPATNQLTGTPNTPVNIAAGGFQTFVISITPSSPFAPTDVALNFNCANTGSAPVLSGLSTLLLSASTGPVSDIVALAATLNNDGIVNIPGTIGTGIFAVATVNVGVGGSIMASADTGVTSLPLNIRLCQTNPTTGACLATPTASVTTQINAGATPTFAFFVTGTSTVPFDPGNNRIVVRFKDGGGVTRGATSVAVRTQ